MGLINVWKVAPQPRPRCADSSTLHRSRQLPQAIFVVPQPGYLLDVCHINWESTYRCRRQALNKYPDPETNQQRENVQERCWWPRRARSRRYGWLQSPLLTGRGCVRCLMHICIRVKRRWAEAHSRKTLWSLSPGFFEVWCGSGPREDVMLGVKWICARVWSLWRKWCKSSWWLRSSGNSSTAVQSLHQRAHTHQQTHQRGSPYFV